MKKLLNAFLSILILLLFVRVQMIHGSSVSGSFNAKFGGADGACSTSIADDFSGDLSKWSDISGDGLWSIAGGVLVGDDQSVILYTDEQTCEVTQWMMAKWGAALNTFGGFYFRSENDETTYAYAVRWEEAQEKFVWRYCGGSTNSNTAENCITIGSGWTPGTVLGEDDFVGIEVSGIGTDTTVKIYDLGVTAKNYANWATSNDQTTTLTDDPDWEANTGKYLGFYNGAAADADFDDFTAGSE